jgi:microcystin-dependent protein
MVDFRQPKTWRRSAGVKTTDLNRELRDQIRSLQKQIIILQNTTSTGTVAPGTIIPISGLSIPNGYLLCDGRQVLRNDYLTLWETIGTAYGPATSLMFTLPDFRGKYLRGNPAAGFGEITARGNASGASPSSVTQNTSVTQTIASVASAGHFHRIDTTHTHNFASNHNYTAASANHAHNNSSHGHGIGGSTANGNRGDGVNARTFASHGHSTNTGSLGATSSFSDSGTIGVNQNANVNSNNPTVTTNTDGAHAHNFDDSISYLHSHSLSTIPNSMELNYVVKT